MKDQTTRAYIFNENQQILLVKHKKDGKWVLPGGRLEQPETIYDCIKREIKEEFNMDIELFGEVVGSTDPDVVDFPAPVAVFEINYVHHKHGLQSRIEYIFFADLVGGEIKVQEEEIYEYKWFDIDEILSMEINKDTFEQVVLVLEKNLELLGEYETVEEHEHTH